MTPNEYLSHHGTKGQRWGLRRYQNPDGTLTALGKIRYRRDVLDNNAKKKDNRIKDLEDNPDPVRWLREDTTRRKDTADAASNLTRTLQQVIKPNEEKRQLKADKRAKKDLATMSDDEIRQLINRKTLEQNYMRLYSEDYAPKVSRGRRALDKTLSAAGTTLALTSSVLGVALAIQQLKAASYGGGGATKPEEE